MSQEDRDTGVPEVFTLDQNYPNPFNPETVISYNLKVSSHVTIKIYDSLGREIITLVNGYQSIGNHTINWKPGANVTSGIYYYRVETQNKYEVKKCVYLK